MIGILISLLIFLLIAMVAIWGVDAIVSALGMPARIGQVAKVIIALIAVLWLLQAFWHPWGGWHPAY